MDPRWEGLFLHLAEGTDAAAAEEFDFLVARGLLSDKANAIHGTALDRADFDAMAAVGSGLVWSPRSNLELYGTTTDVGAALDAGVEVSLSPDWAVTGSSNMLDELRVAAQWNTDHLGGRLSDEDLVDMVTSIPAHQAGIDDEVGSIRPGLRADLLVVDGDHNDPYGALVDARPADVELVMVGGEAVYGADAVMAELWPEDAVEAVTVDGEDMALRLPAGMGRFADVVARLEPAIATQGLTLAPLTE
jgi:cytosine/adenosine deaminase-related metal-dependent hydrolase